jgi:hypothetical protein
MEYKMILDKNLELASAQVVTVSAASTNVINQGSANAYEGEVNLICQVKEAVLAAGAATVNIVIQTSVDEAFTAPIVLFDSGAIGKAALVLNSEPLKIEIPYGSKQFIRGYFVVANGPLTAGKFSLFVAESVDVK